MASSLADSEALPGGWNAWQAKARRAASPWKKPCELELAAFAHTLCDTAMMRSEDAGEAPLQQVPYGAHASTRSLSGLNALSRDRERSSEHRRVEVEAGLCLFTPFDAL
jgi:hypothetical protein